MRKVLPFFIFILAPVLFAQDFIADSILVTTPSSLKHIFQKRIIAKEKNCFESLIRINPDLKNKQIRRGTLVYLPDNDSCINRGYFDSPIKIKNIKRALSASKRKALRTRRPASIKKKRKDSRKISSISKNSNLYGVSFYNHFSHIIGMNTETNTKLKLQTKTHMGLSINNQFDFETFKILTRFNHSELIFPQDVGSGVENNHMKLTDFDFKLRYALSTNLDLDLKQKVGEHFSHTSLASKVDLIKYQRGVSSIGLKYKLYTANENTLSVAADYGKSFMISNSSHDINPGSRMGMELELSTNISDNKSYSIILSHTEEQSGIDNYEQDFKSSGFLFNFNFDLTNKH